MKINVLSFVISVYLIIKPRKKLVLSSGSNLDPGAVFHFYNATPALEIFGNKIHVY